MREQHPRGNQQWGAVLWAEATLVHDVPSATPIQPIQSSGPLNTTPADGKFAESSVTVVAIDEEQQSQGNGNGILFSPTAEETKQEVTTATYGAPWVESNFLTCIIGGSLAVGAVAATFGLDLGAAVVYMLAAGFYKVYQFLDNANKNNANKNREEGAFLVIAMPVYFSCFLFLMIVSSLPLVDVILLSVSVLVAEILAMMAFLLCPIFGGSCCGRCSMASVHSKALQFDALGFSLVSQRMETRTINCGLFYWSRDGTDAEDTGQHGPAARRRSGCGRQTPGARGVQLKSHYKYMRVL